MSQEKMIIIGAGPIGVEAALYASQLGYEVEVLEKDRVGANILSWGNVTLFSPWEMNHSALGIALLRQQFPEWREPAAEDYQTGKEFVETYLLPLSKLPQLQNKIHTGVEVLNIGREKILKGELIGDNSRTNYPFRILTRSESGREQICHADIVIDATGVYGNHNWLGDGGIPALGEHASVPFIEYLIPDVYRGDRSRFSGKKTLLVGAGYSAATTICDFRNLIREEPETSLIWAIRQNREVPIPEIADDPLPNRAGLTAQANAIAQNDAPQIQFRKNTTIEAIHFIKEKDKFSVGLNSDGKSEEIAVDRVIANVGYGPDNSLYRELQVHECYASRGPMNLASALLGSSSADCLAQTGMGADTLKNPEPNFYIIGNKSYGRNPTFLLRIGLSQITEVFSLITGDENSNLYEAGQTEKVSH